MGQASSAVGFSAPLVAVLSIASSEDGTRADVQRPPPGPPESSGNLTERLAERAAWRVVKGNAAEDLVVGMEVRPALRDWEGNGELVYGYSPSGTSLARLELVQDRDLEGFLNDNQPALDEIPGPWSGDQLCKHGRFLLNDARVGLFHNQRISYEVAITIAQLLRRTLVMPGFFKFPHPDAYDGTQWVPVKEIFHWARVQECNPNTIDLGDLIKLCGADVLDRHVAVPFSNKWMRSKKRAPWINGTRPLLRWRPFHGGDPLVQLRPRRTLQEVPLDLNEPLWFLLRTFLAPDVIGARTVRVHGLAAADVYIRGHGVNVPVCFVPGQKVLKEAQTYIDSFSRDDVEGPPRVLAVHLRIFKQKATGAGSYIRAEVADWFEHTCNIEPEIFIPFVAHMLAAKFHFFTPTHTFVASNEADSVILSKYLDGFPGRRKNLYTPAQYEVATTAEESAEALRSVVVDAYICAAADVFIGNKCSTMSEYILELRRNYKFDLTRSFLLGGVHQVEMLDIYRDQDLYRRAREFNSRSNV